MPTRLAPLAALFAFAVSPAAASEWPHFRGPFFNGSTDEKNLPSAWSATENIAWEAELPGPSAATPIIWRDHVFVSSVDSKEEALQALCFDARDGSLRWERKVSKEVGRDERSNYASPSPVTDGKLVVFFYGNGALAAFDFDGKELWSRDIQKDFGEFAFLWTFASSPLLYGGRLYLQVLQRDVSVDGRGFRDRENESYLLALEPSTGKVLWRHVRPSDAVAESREAFSSPVPFDDASGKALLIAGGDALTAHDPQSGKELWRWATWNPQMIGHWRLVPSPVASKEVVLVCAPKSDPVYAIRAGGSGNLGKEAVAWASRGVREVSSDVPTPAYYDGDFFVLNDLRKTLSRVEAGSGKVKWRIDTPGLSKYEASPLLGDGKVYLINFHGEVTVVDAASGEISKTIPMEKKQEYPIRSTIAAANGRLFIRLNRRLVCVGPEPSAG
jgi:outer membrane protein assembly factor BamB